VAVVSKILTPSFLEQVINGYDVTQGWTTFHQQGRIALLKLRDAENLKTKTSHHIWGFIFVIHVSLVLFATIDRHFLTTSDTDGEMHHLSHATTR
jgi:hypothetical protein